MRSTVRAEEREVLATSEDVRTMIDWNAETWGNKVHECSHGSWVADRHDRERDAQDSRD